MPKRNNTHCLRLFWGVLENNIKLWCENRYIGAKLNKCFPLYLYQLSRDSCSSPYMSYFEYVVMG